MSPNPKDLANRLNRNKTHFYFRNNDRHPVVFHYDKPTRFPLSRKIDYDKTEYLSFWIPYLRGTIRELDRALLSANNLIENYLH